MESGWISSSRFWYPPGRYFWKGIRMSRMGSFVLGVGVGVVGLYLAMHFTLIQAEDGFHVIPKIAAKLEKPFEDVRGYKLSHWQRKQALAVAIVKADKAYLLKDPSLLAFREQTQMLVDRYRSKPVQGGLNQGS